MDESNLKTCTRCLVPRQTSWFGRQRYAKDGLNWWCKDCNKRHANLYYHENKAPDKKEEWRLFKALNMDVEKHKDKWRARWAIGAAVYSGKLPKVSTLICADCGGKATRYDHYLGYAEEHRLHVQPVCRRCDGVRDAQRGIRRIHV